jgi:NTE family protein
MGNVLRWVGRAVGGLRSFAYGPAGERPRVGLALGGGFARGIAHIGVLRVLNEHGIPIDYIAGTSVGALIGAAYAGGTSLEEMELQGFATRFRDFGRWTLSRMGMATNDRLEDFLHRLTTVKYFEELEIPFCIVATDLVLGESVEFTEGEIATPLRASCAYPGLFLPVEYQGRVLVDGFLTAAVPTEAVRHMGADVVIGVHLEPGMLRQKPRNTIEVIGRSFSIIQGTARMPWRDFADVILQPDVQHVLWDEFAKTPQLIAAGEAEARRLMPDIQAALARRSPAPARRRSTYRYEQET